MADASSSAVASAGKASAAKHSDGVSSKDSRPKSNPHDMQAAMGVVASAKEASARVTSQCCAVCFEIEETPEDVLMTCVGCGMVVHDQCYGVGWRTNDCELANTTKPIPYCKLQRPAKMLTLPAFYTQLDEHGADSASLATFKAIDPCRDCFDTKAAMPKSICTAIDEAYQHGQGVTFMCALCQANVPKTVPVACPLCPFKGSRAMKPMARHANGGAWGWVHITCALWTPGMGFEFPESRDGVVGLGDVQRERWNLDCALCCAHNVAGARKQWDPADYPQVKTEFDLRAKQRASRGAAARSAGSYGKRWEFLGGVRRSENGVVNVEGPGEKRRRYTKRVHLTDELLLEGEKGARELWGVALAERVVAGCGAPIQCSVPACRTAFHATCALRAGWALSMEPVSSGRDGDEEEVALRAYCAKHGGVVTTIAADHVCSLCRKATDAETMLLCDDCDAGYHMGCLDPPLTTVPDGDWFCPACETRRRATGTLVDSAGGAGVVALTPAVLDRLAGPSALMTDDEDDGGESCGSGGDEAGTPSARDAVAAAAPAPAPVRASSAEAARQATQASAKAMATTFFSASKSKPAGAAKGAAAAATTQVQWPDESQLREHLAGLPPKQAAAVAKLHRYHAQSFRWWDILVHAGFNLLFYGFGSKMSLLRAFVRVTMPRHAVIEVNTAVPGVTLRGLFTAICRDFLGHTSTFKSTTLQAAFIAACMSSRDVPAGSDVGWYSAAESALHAGLAVGKAIHGDAHQIAPGIGVDAAGLVKALQADPGSAGAAGEDTALAALQKSDAALPAAVSIAAMAVAKGIATEQQEQLVATYRIGRELAKLPENACLVEGILRATAQEPAPAATPSAATPAAASAPAAASDAPEPNGAVTAAAPPTASSAGTPQPAQPSLWQQQFTAAQQSMIAEARAKHAQKHLVIVVHGISAQHFSAPGPLRDLCTVACADRIHIVASTDSPHAGVAFDSATRVAGRWLWVDGTTYADYEAERQFGEPLARASDTSSSAGMVWVLASLTPNHRAILQLLVDYHQENPASSGMSWDEWYAAASDAMLVTSDRVFRQHLVEFRDHNLIESVRVDRKEVQHLVPPTDAVQQALQVAEQAATH